MKSKKEDIRDNSITVSNISGGITDEEFADEFMGGRNIPASDRARFQFNFVGAELEKINSAQNVRDELTKRP